MPWRVLKSAPVAAVELADRAALRSVEGKPGLPEGIRALGPNGAALLVETRAADGATLAAQIRDDRGGAVGARDVRARSLLAPTRPNARVTGTCARACFLRSARCARSARPSSSRTSPFPFARLAEATLDLQRLLATHGYPDAIIFGHALEGNLHFVFTQDFNAAAEVERYRGFMDAMCRMVVDKYDGSLKAEHGTGRNIAPFVELEWGAEAYALMCRIKRLFDPRGLLNPGVVINADPDAHVKNLKPLPQCDPIVDQCIECGFCEPKCPSRGMTLSPRQRIVGWREIARLERTDEHDAEASATLRGLYDYHGIDTCAACGLCATACPVGIETGLLIKSLRGERSGALAHRVAAVVADHYGAVTAGVRAGLTVADLLHGLVGTSRAAALARHRAPPFRRRGTQVVAGAAARRSLRARGTARRGRVRNGSSTFRAVPRARWARSAATTAEALPAVAERLFRKAGFDVLYPETLAELCCGQPFESKGFLDVADRKSAELERALRAASDNGRWPIVFDTSPCAYRMRRYCGARLPVQDSIEFIHDTVLPRVAIQPQARAGRHPSGLQRAQDGHGGQARRALPDAAAARSSRCTTCFAAASQATRASTARSSTSTRCATSGKPFPAGCDARLLVEPNLRDRAIRAGGLSLSFDHSSRRRVRKRARRCHAQMRKRPS